MNAGGWPLAFPVPAVDARELVSGMEPGSHRCIVRSLSGMQKEALVAVDPSRCWRLVCDEGHYLNGTDLAPPPLDFFSAGMQFSILSSIARTFRARGVALRALSIDQETVYRIEGSFLAGNARGSAAPPLVRLRMEAGAEDAVPLVADAIRGAPAVALARDVLANHFRISIRGRSVTGSFDETFERLRVEERPPEPVIEKISTAERVENDPHGAGVGLAAEQRRKIHVKGRGEWLGDHRFLTDVDLIHPIGSSFRFRADETGESAPAPEAFLVAGVAFCYMTQLGRYAAIRKRPLANYRVFQENCFLPDEAESARCRARPFTTAVFLESDWSDSEADDLVQVGERTCYLHATMREALEPKVTLEWRGHSIPLAG